VKKFKVGENMSYDMCNWQWILKVKKWKIKVMWSQ